MRIFPVMNAPYTGSMTQEEFILIHKEGLKDFDHIAHLERKRPEVKPPSLEEFPCPSCTEKKFIWDKKDEGGGKEGTILWHFVYCDNCGLVVSQKSFWGNTQESVVEQLISLMR